MEERRNHSNEEKLHVDRGNYHEAFDGNEDLNFEAQLKKILSNTMKLIIGNVRQ